MKIISVAFVFVFGAAMQVLAQRDDKPNRFISRVDIVAGVGAGFLRGGIPVSTNEVQQRHLKFSYCFGLEFFHQLNDKVSVSALSLYEHKGSTYTGEGVFFNQATQMLETGRWRKQHIYENYTLPVLINFQARKDSKFQISAGPFVSFLSKQVVQDYNPMGTRGMTDETKLNRKFEGGLMIRLGKQIPLNEHIAIILMLTNLYGMTDTRLVKNYGVTKSNVTYILIGITIKR